MLTLISVLVAAASAHADDNISMGAEFETAEGVIGFTTSGTGTAMVKTAHYPELTTNERALCTVEESFVPGWPVVSFTHDMGWSNRARTLEIVLGPARDGDVAAAVKATAAIQAVYRFLHLQRITACDESVVVDYCFVSIAAVRDGVTTPKLRDTGCGGDFLAKNPASYDATKAGFLISKDYYSRSDNDIWTQITLGIKKAALIDTSAEKLFAKAHGERAISQRDLFADIQVEISTKLSSKPKAQQSLLLYATYAIMTFVRNGATISNKDRGGDGYHAPIWKNAFELYPKTSVKTILTELTTADPTLTADFVYTNVAAAADSTLKAANFKKIWNRSLVTDALDQAKPGDNTATLLLEVRVPSSKLITLHNMDKRNTQLIMIPSFTFEDDEVWAF